MPRSTWKNHWIERHSTPRRDITRRCSELPIREQRCRTAAGRSSSFTSHMAVAPGESLDEDKMIEMVVDKFPKFHECPTNLQLAKSINEQSEHQQPPENQQLDQTVSQPISASKEPPFTSSHSSPLNPVNEKLGNTIPNLPLQVYSRRKVDPGPMLVQFSDPIAGNEERQSVYGNKDNVDEDLVDIIKKLAEDEAALDAFVSIVTGPPGPNPVQLIPKINLLVLEIRGDQDTFTPIDGPVALSNAALYLFEGCCAVQSSGFSRWIAAFNQAEKLHTRTLPYPYTSKEVFEQSIRMPIGPEFNPVTAVGALNRPQVVKRTGVSIKPI
ncbi:unnamed protein product [Fraxinus pennsylvanica]|uniref:Uncharacterized protein n=1 Tax=Fraxinus pennsylvanica TaxID=56036 RepID=A0AAD2E256_9LAMI|nr:unnamed protein product [Fraxinus pennsylvanica]